MTLPWAPVAWPAGARLFLERARVARLATADSNARPHVIPICYAVVEDQLFSVVDDKPKATRRGLRRLRNIEANPQVAVVVDHYDEDWSALGWCLLEGEASLVDEAGEFDRALAALRERYRQYESMDLAFATHPMIVVAIRRCVHWSARPSAG